MKRTLFVTAIVAVLLTGCRPPIRPGMPQHEAWTWTESRKAEQYLVDHPVVTLRPDRPVPDDCKYMEMVAAGPGFGVAGEQHNVLIVASLMGATHVQWEDVETAHLYRCPEETRSRSTNKEGAPSQ